ncbi:MerR family transcriptional regulator [Fodinibacter luteus]|uniref:MerR family transcriptional regulator n=1 Tax=Fodinibacter luteus TaxID=552064 RepID=A0ABP8KGT3_9MICO
MLIGEVAQRSGISSRMLRHYDRTGVVSPSGRTPGGYRDYTDEELRRLFYAEALRSLGLTLKEVAAALDTPDFVPVTLVEQLIDRTRERIRQHQQLLRTLERVHGSDPADWADVLHTMGLLRGLEATSPSARHRFALSLSDPLGRDVPLVVEAALSEPDPAVAGSLRWALARAGDAAVPLLREALDCADADRRRRAVEALEKVNTATSRAALAQALPHHDPLVNRRAALAAGADGDPASIPVLTGLIVEGHDDGDAAGTLGALAERHGLALEVDRAIARALADGRPEQRLRLTSALADIPGPMAVQRLRELTSDPDRRVASAARFALEETKSRTLPDREAPARRPRPR